MSDSFEVYAIKYGRQAEAVHRSEIFYRYSIYDQPDAVVPMDYYTWVLTSGDRCIVLDTGCTKETADDWGIEYFGRPSQALSQLGIAPTEVTDVVLSHLHYDHSGTTQDYPNATIHLNSAEWEFWSGPALGWHQFADIVVLPDIEHLLHAFSDGRVHYTTDGQSIAPGLTVRHTPGHTPGHQILEVATKDSSILLLADAAHLYEQLEQDWPHNAMTNMPDVYASYAKIRAWADGDLGRVVPGHDPRVAERFNSVLGAKGNLLRLA